MRKRAMAITVAILSAAALALAADWVNNDIDVTATSQTLTLDSVGSGYKTFWYRNDGANEVFVCPWRSGETVAACTAALGRRLEPGEAKAWTVDKQSPSPGGGRQRRGFTYASVICSSAETSNDNRAEAFDPF